MAKPNIVNVTSINGALIAGSVTGSPVGIIDVPDNKLYKINTIHIANHTTSAQTVYIEVSVDNGSTYFYLTSNLSVPGSSAILVLANPMYMDETDLMRISGGTSLDYFVSYEILDDA